jgi:hypothetical protein
VKVSGIVNVVFALLVVVMLLLGHGPGRHDRVQPATMSSPSLHSQTVMRSTGTR